MSAAANRFDVEMTYKVVINSEEQYSIWPANREIPFGWEFEGTEGLKTACIDHIQAVWTDLRPKSVREAMRTGSPA